MIFHKTLNIKRYSSHNFQDIGTSFGHKVDRTIYMLTWYRFFDKCVLRGFIDKNGILSINPLNPFITVLKCIMSAPCRDVMAKFAICSSLCIN